MREGAAVQRFDAGNTRCHHPACVVVNRARKTRRRSYLKRDDDDDDDDDDALDRPDRAYRGTDDDERLEHVARSKYWVVYRFGNLYRKREVELWESFLILSP